MNKKNTKEKSKKLTLSAETLRNLNEPELLKVAGGYTKYCGETGTICSACPTCP
jgi:hypothetical protein